MQTSITGDTIGIRQLKAHLSACLARVQAGERLTVTDRGRPIATIAPVEAPAVPGWAMALLSEGRARWSGGKPAGLDNPISSRGKPASRMVIEDRR